MKKQTKGAIAAAAAGALLLGGAGSLAYWSDSSTIGGNTITAGELQIADCVAAAGTSGWASTNPTTIAIPTADLAAYRIVPTEVLEYNCTTSITAIGDRLNAVIEADPASITAGTTAATGATAGELLANIDVETTVTVDGNVVTAASPLTEANNGDAVAVTVVITFDNVNDLVAQGASINLTDLALKIEQTAINP